MPLKPVAVPKIQPMIQGPTKPLSVAPNTYIALFDKIREEKDRARIPFEETHLRRQVKAKIRP